MLLAPMLAGCSASGGLGSSNQVIVRNEADPNNFAAAQQIADQQCAARGRGGARFVLWINSQGGGGQNGGARPGPPDVIFDCTPAR